jgi:hypothetical protein
MDDLTHWIGEQRIEAGCLAVVEAADGPAHMPLRGYIKDWRGGRAATNWKPSGENPYNSAWSLRPAAPQIVVSEAMKQTWWGVRGSIVETNHAALIAQWLRETPPETVAAIQAAVREGRL